MIEAYEESRYNYLKMDDPDNEIDWHIPIKEKEPENKE